MTGIDPLALKETLTRLFKGSATGLEFAATLAAHGFRLVRGRRAAFCILDGAGHLHSLARRLEGVSSDELSIFLNGITL